jgi:hypothetical protein
MTMLRGVTEIDRLIEQGLSLYGEGDIDGALLLWERALLIDPDNPQANSYVEYVRINYELLTGDGNTEHSGPFGIGDDDPDYQIEILPGDEVGPIAPTRRFSEARDEGWMIGDEHGAASQRPIGPVTLELEADEPPPVEPASFDNMLTGEAISFDDATREYPGGAGRPAVALLGDGAAFPALIDPADFVPEVTPAFGSVADLQTPPGFGSEVTEMRRRDLGFVQPAAPRTASGPPELKMTLRTPSQVMPVIAAASDLHRAPTADGDDAVPGHDALALELDPPPPPPDSGPAYASLDLDLAPGLGASALDLGPPLETRPTTERAPGAPDADPALPALAALPRSPVPEPAPLGVPTREFPDKPVAVRAAPPADDPMVSAPTRDLGLRVPGITAAGSARGGGPASAALGPVRDSGPAGAPPGGVSPSIAARDAFGAATAAISGSSREPGLGGGPVEPARERRLGTEEETTRELEIQKLRKGHVTGRPQVPAMDPIDARSAEILEGIDRDAPAVETREERTRRRITALLDRATEWGRGSDLERAVTAVDLALSEDPNSALAQKLVHRNRETIMNAFQGFLGDLERAPALARPLHELGSAPISPRAAFLLSRVDGTLSLDEILDVSGMPRLEAYRYLCQLFLRGILR